MPCLYASTLLTESALQCCSASSDKLMQMSTSHFSGTTKWHMPLRY